MELNDIHSKCEKCREDTIVTGFIGFIAIETTCTNCNKKVILELKK